MTLPAFPALYGPFLLAALLHIHITCNIPSIISPTEGVCRFAYVATAASCPALLHLSQARSDKSQSLSRDSHLPSRPRSGPDLRPGQIQTDANPDQRQDTPCAIRKEEHFNIPSSPPNLYPPYLPSSPQPAYPVLRLRHRSPPLVPEPINYTPHTTHPARGPAPLALSPILTLRDRSAKTQVESPAHPFPT